ncbi:MAG TPA: SEC-C metal-binding domain-containing protein, partial [Acidimicrobiales bacterium]
RAQTAATDAAEPAPSGDGGNGRRGDGQPAPVPANTPLVRSEWEKTPRNAPCPCGSGKKFKQCHGR